MFERHDWILVTIFYAQIFCFSPTVSRRNFGKVKVLAGGQWIVQMWKRKNMKNYIALSQYIECNYNMLEYIITTQYINNITEHRCHRIAYPNNRKPCQSGRKNPSSRALIWDRFFSCKKTWFWSLGIPTVPPKTPSRSAGPRAWACSSGRSDSPERYLLARSTHERRGFKSHHSTYLSFKVFWQIWSFGFFS